MSKLPKWQNIPFFPSYCLRDNLLACEELSHYKLDKGTEAKLVASKIKVCLYFEKLNLFIFLDLWKFTNLVEKAANTPSTFLMVLFWKAVAVVLHPIGSPSPGLLRSHLPPYMGCHICMSVCLSFRLSVTCASSKCKRPGLGRTWDGC